jgi:hypothetical protein
MWIAHPSSHSAQVGWALEGRCGTREPVLLGSFDAHELDVLPSWGAVCFEDFPVTILGSPHAG